jgi:hypothetical protein
MSVSYAIFIDVKLYRLFLKQAAVLSVRGLWTKNKELHKNVS